MSKISVYTLYIILYLIVIFVISIYHALKIKSVDEAGRNVDFWRIIGTIIATSCGAAAFIGFVGLGYAGGVERVIAITPQHYWQPLGSHTIQSFLAIALTVGPFYLVWQTTWQRIFWAKNENIAVKGVSIGMILACIILSLSFLIGIISRGYLPDNIKADLVFTQAIDSVFPEMLGGIVILGLMAALMSGGDSFIMMGSVSIARDLYQQYLKPEASYKQMLLISRYSVVIISLLSLMLAYVGKGIIPIYLLIIKISGAAIVFPFLALMLWRRSTKSGVITGMAAGIIVTIILSG